MELVSSDTPLATRRPLVIQKYGGSSLATPRHIRQAAKRIKSVKQSGNDVVVVVSAMGRMTDHLIKLAKRTVARPPQRELDMLMTAGERVSMALLAMALEEEGVPAISFTGSQSGIVTSGHHTDARILTIRAHRAQQELERGRVVIVAGFQGVSEQKEVTTLGRGGSDTSAVALAAVLGAARCEILTDVEGLFTADPRLVKNARLLSVCSYDEALELASLGAKMHARSLEVAKRFSVDVRIVSSASMAVGTGTRIAADGFSAEGTKMEATAIRGVATKDGFHYFRAKIRPEILAALAASVRAPLRFFSYGEGEVRFLCEKDRAEFLGELLAARRIVFEELGKVATVSAVGEGLSASCETLPSFLEALGAAGIEPLLVASNSLSITAAVPSEKRASAAQAVHAALVEPPSSTA